VAYFWFQNSLSWVDAELGKTPSALRPARKLQLTPWHRLRWLQHWAKVAHG
jgi:hypothetical protein